MLRCLARGVWGGAQLIQQSLTPFGDRGPLLAQEARTGQQQQSVFTGRFGGARVSGSVPGQCRGAAGGEDQVPVVLSIAGQTSPVVTMAVTVGGRFAAQPVLDPLYH